MAQNPIHACGDPLTPPPTQARSASRPLATHDRQPNAHKLGEPTPINSEHTQEGRMYPDRPQRAAKTEIARSKPLYVSFISPVAEVRLERAESAPSPSSARREPKNRQNPPRSVLRRSSEHHAPATSSFFRPKTAAAACAKNRDFCTILHNAHPPAHAHSRPDNQPLIKNRVRFARSPSCCVSCC